MTQKKPKKRDEITPFDFASSISQANDNLFAKYPSAARIYNPWVVNLILGQHLDCVILVNEANQRLSTLPPIAHYEYLFYSVKKKKRWGKWHKKADNEKVKFIMSAYRISEEKASDVVDLFSDQDIENIRNQYFSNLGGESAKDTET